MGRPLTPPPLLIRSTAIWMPTSAVLPPAAAVPDRGWSEPSLKGLACPKAAFHGAGTSMEAPSAPAAAAPRPRRCRRVTLPLYQKSSASAHDSLCQCSVIVILLLTALPSGGRPRCSGRSWPPIGDRPERDREGLHGLPDLVLPVAQGDVE